MRQPSTIAEALDQCDAKTLPDVIIGFYQRYLIPELTRISDSIQPVILPDTYVFQPSQLDRGPREPWGTLTLCGREFSAPYAAAPMILFTLLFGMGFYLCQKVSENSDDSNPVIDAFTIVFAVLTGASGLFSLFPLSKIFSALLDRAAKSECATNTENAIGPHAYAAMNRIIRLFQPAQGRLTDEKFEIIKIINSFYLTRGDVIVWQNEPQVRISTIKSYLIEIKTQLRAAIRRLEKVRLQPIEKKAEDVELLPVASLISEDYLTDQKQCILAYFAAKQIQSGDVSVIRWITDFYPVNPSSSILTRGYGSVST